MARQNIRAELDQLLPSSADFNAFVLDYFREIYFRFSDGMERKARTNLLLELGGEDEVRKALTKYRRKQAARRRGAHPKQPADTAEKSRLSITFSGVLNEETRKQLQALLAGLRQLADDISLTIVDARPGSIILLLEGTQQGIERIYRLYHEHGIDYIADWHIEKMERVAGLEEEDFHLFMKYWKFSERTKIVSDIIKDWVYAVTRVPRWAQIIIVIAAGCTLAAAHPPVRGKLRAAAVFVIKVVQELIHSERPSSPRNTAPSHRSRPVTDRRNDVGVAAELNAMDDLGAADEHPQPDFGDDTLDSTAPQPIDMAMSSADLRASHHAAPDLGNLPMAVTPDDMLPVPGAYASVWINDGSLSSSIDKSLSVSQFFIDKHWIQHESWSKAKQYCRSRGKYLAIIHELIVAQNKYPDRFDIGAYFIDNFAPVCTEKHDDKKKSGSILRTWKRQCRDDVNHRALAFKNTVTWLGSDRIVLSGRVEPREQLQKSAWTLCVLRTSQVNQIGSLATSQNIKQELVPRIVPPVRGRRHISAQDVTVEVSDLKQKPLTKLLHVHPFDIEWEDHSGDSQRSAISHERYSCADLGMRRPYLAEIQAALQDESFAKAVSTRTIPTVNAGLHCISALTCEEDIGTTVVARVDGSPPYRAYIAGFRESNPPGLSVCVKAQVPAIAYSLEIDLEKRPAPIRIPARQKVEISLERGSGLVPISLSEKTPEISMAIRSVTPFRMYKDERSARRYCEKNKMRLPSIVELQAATSISEVKNLLQAHEQKKQTSYWTLNYGIDCSREDGLCTEEKEQPLIGIYDSAMNRFKLVTRAPYDSSAQHSVVCVADRRGANAARQLVFPFPSHDISAVRPMIRVPGRKQQVQINVPSNYRIHAENLGDFMISAVGVKVREARSWEDASSYCSSVGLTLPSLLQLQAAFDMSEIWKAVSGVEHKYFYTGNLAIEYGEFDHQWKDRPGVYVVAEVHTQNGQPKVSVGRTIDVGEEKKLKAGVLCVDGQWTHPSLTK